MAKKRLNEVSEVEQIELEIKLLEKKLEQAKIKEHIQSLGFSGDSSSILPTLRTTEQEIEEGGEPTVTTIGIGTDYESNEKGTFDTLMNLKDLKTRVKNSGDFFQVVVFEYSDSTYKDTKNMAYILSLVIVSRQLPGTFKPLIGESGYTISAIESKIKVEFKEYSGEISIFPYFRTSMDAEVFLDMISCEELIEGLKLL